MEDVRKRAERLLEKINVEQKKKELRIIETQASNPTFWQNHKTASEKMKRLSVLQKEIEEIDLLQDSLSAGNFAKAQEIINKLEKVMFFSNQYDQQDAILAIHSGQGGTEAMDWAAMLYRMYTRFFERKGWKFEVIDETPGEEAGIKSITVDVCGEYAYGLLKGEAGVHRLVRQSPFNADKLRQTSFALVDVLPQIEDEADIQLKENDLEWEFYRASSHGGQNVQKVSSAVRLKHIPTGIVVTAQSERYQGQNRENALKILRAKLWLLQEEKKKKEEQKIKGEYKTPGWGNQIRSYVLHPYHMVKDLRTNYQTANTDAVLDGDLDEFIEAQLRQFS